MDRTLSRGPLASHVCQFIVTSRFVSPPVTFLLCFSLAWLTEQVLLQECESLLLPELLFKTLFFFSKTKTFLYLFFLSASTFLLPRETAKHLQQGSLEEWWQWPGASRLGTVLLLHCYHVLNLASPWTTTLLRGPVIFWAGLCRYWPPTGTRLSFHHSLSPP